MLVKGHSAFESFGMVSYSTSTVTMAVSVAVCEISSVNV